MADLSSDPTERDPSSPSREGVLARRLRWGAVLGAVAVVATVVIWPSAWRAVIPASSTGTGTDLLRDDFEGTGPFAFVQEEDDLIRLAVAEGSYRISIKDASEWQPIRHIFDEGVPAVRFEATITQVVPSGFGSVFSMGCWRGDVMYGVSLTPDRFVGLHEYTPLEDGLVNRSPLAEINHHPAVRSAGNPNAVRIDCSGAIDGRPGTLSGWVNGIPVATAVIPNAPQAFDKVGFFIDAFGDDTEFRVDDVRAVASVGPTPEIVPPTGLGWGSAPQRYERSGVSFSFPPSWAILDGESAANFSVGPEYGRGLDWVKVSSWDLPPSAGNDRTDHLSMEQVSDLLHRVSRGTGTVEDVRRSTLAGVSGFEARLRGLEVRRETLDGRIFLWVERGTVRLLACQYRSSSESEVLSAWQLAKETFDA